jgi:PAS domain S-box-containing protein
MIGDFCMLISDITDIKQMEIALRESHEKLEQRVIERTTALAKTVDELAESRQNAMQMMNEAVAARNELEIANINLTNQILGRKLAQHALNESEIKYKNLVENSSIGVFQTKINGAIIYVNNGIVKILDYDSVEQLKSESSLMLYKDANQRHFLIGQLLEYGVLKDYEVTVITRRGTEKTLIVSIKLEGDTIDGTAFDITERKLAEAEIKLKNEKLQTLNATKDKFFSIIAHDLKSPFNAIMGFSEILVEQVNEEKYSGVAKYSKIIHSSSQRALDLLTNLMDWARSQTGRMEFIPEYFELVDFINDIIPIFTDIAGQKSITIFTGVPPNAPIFADQAMISTVFRNLISNAIKFTKPGGEIIIAATENQTEIVVSVKDNGVGIPRDMIGKLFRIDENYTTSGTANERGTGLGLILCKEFVEKHGGRIWVESVEGRGSVFSFNLPVT